MYFLVKNARSCPESLCNNYQLKSLYKDGHLNFDYFYKNISSFSIHPEKLRQALRERDANMLCKFFDSEEYKKKVTTFLELQSKILSKNAIDGERPTNIKYQHILSCAQPSYQAAKTIIGDNVKEDKQIKPGTSKKRKSKKGTVVEQILRMKSKEEREEADIRYTPVKKSRLKKVTHRTTIMPIFLKKMKNKPRHVMFEDSHDFNYDADDETVLDPAEKLEQIQLNSIKPSYTQILHKSNISNNRFKKDKIQSVPEKSINHHIYKLKSVPSSSKEKTLLPDRGINSTSMLTSSSAKSLTTKLCPKKNMNRKSYSQLLLIEPVKCRSYKQKCIIPKIDRNDSVKFKTIKKNESTGPEINLMELVKEAQKKKQLNFEENLETKHNMNITKKNEEAERNNYQHEIQLLPLFKRLKTGNMKIPQEMVQIKTPKESEHSRSSADKTNCLKRGKKQAVKQSCTYKIVTKHKHRIKPTIKEKFGINTVFWKNSIDVNPGNLNVTEMSHEKSSVVTKNVVDCLHKPIPHFVQCVKKPGAIRINQCSGFHKSAKLPPQ